MTTTRLWRVAALATLMAMLAAPAAPAQEHPDLSGTWVLDTGRSDFGPMPAPASRTDLIEHREPALVIHRTVMTQNGEVKASFTYAVDGQPHENASGGQTVTSVLSWEGKTLLMHSTVSTPQGELTLDDRYDLSEDGTTLTIGRTLSVQGQSLSQTMVFTRQ